MIKFEPRCVMHKVSMTKTLDEWSIDVIIGDEIRYFGRVCSDKARTKAMREHLESPEYYTKLIVDALNKDLEE